MYLYNITLLNEKMIDKITNYQIINIIWFSLHQIIVLRGDVFP